MTEPVTAEDLRSGPVQDQLDLAATLYLEAVFRYGVEHVRALIRGTTFDPSKNSDLQVLADRIREVLEAAEIVSLPVEEPEWDDLMDTVMDRLAKVRGEAVPVAYIATKPPPKENENADC